jgi:hypothetical protein
LNDNDGKQEDLEYIAVEVKEGVVAGDDDNTTNRMTTKQRI